MSSLTAERLYSLLPAVYRLRDADQGEPLRGLIGALAQEFAGLEENLAQLYDDEAIRKQAFVFYELIGDHESAQQLRAEFQAFTTAS